MTKFEKASKRAELLGQAYQAIIEEDKWDNYDDPQSDVPTLRDDRTEEHEFYMSIAKEIEKLLQGDRHSRVQAQARLLNYG